VVDYIIGYMRNPQNGMVVTRRQFRIQHHTLYQYKHSAVMYARKHRDTLMKPIVILRKVDDEHYVVVDIIE